MDKLEQFKQRIENNLAKENYSRFELVYIAAGFYADEKAIPVEAIHYIQQLYQKNKITK